MKKFVIELEFQETEELPDAESAKDYVKEALGDTGIDPTGIRIKSYYQGFKELDFQEKVNAAHDGN